MATTDTNTQVPQKLNPDGSVLKDVYGADEFNWASINAGNMGSPSSADAVTANAPLSMADLIDNLKLPKELQDLFFGQGNLSAKIGALAPLNAKDGSIFNKLGLSAIPGSGLDIKQDLADRQQVATGQGILNDIASLILNKPIDLFAPQAPNDKSGVK